MRDNISLLFPAISENESLARTVAAVCASKLNPTVEQLSDIKTAVSEAVTNCIVHGYEDGEGDIEMQIGIEGNELMITIVGRAHV